MKKWIVQIVECDSNTYGQRSPMEVEADYIHIDDGALIFSTEENPRIAIVAPGKWYGVQEA